MCVCVCVCVCVCMEQWSNRVRLRLWAGGHVGRTVVDNYVGRTIGTSTACGMAPSSGRTVLLVVQQRRESTTLTVCRPQVTG